MNLPELLKHNREIRDMMLQDISIDNKYKLLYDEVPFGYIYCIENKKNGKKYIGSTYSYYSSNDDILPRLNKRLSHYLYEYNKLRNSTRSIKYVSRPIIRAMVDDDIENFIMYPLAETTKQNHFKAEDYFIQKYNTIKNGYNVHKKARGNPIGRNMTVKDKLLRSDPIIAIHLNHKKIIFSDSMKLLADYLNTSKDIIKNNNRQGRVYKGWYIFYIDADKRNYVFNYYVLQNNLGIQKRGNPRYHSESSKKFYSELISKVSLYLKNPQGELFSDFQILDPLEYK